jgi:hypothetical protein
MRQFFSYVLFLPMGSSVPHPPRLKFYISDITFCAFAARTWMILVELGLPFEMVHVDVRSKPE